MTKCAICGNKITETFLGKIKGSYFKVNGKLNAVCFECQKKLKTKEEILNKIK